MNMKRREEKASISFISYENEMKRTGVDSE